MLVPDTVPEPLPPLLWTWMLGLVKVAVTVFGPSIVSWQRFVPVQGPLNPLKMDATLPGAVNSRIAPVVDGYCDAHVPVALPRFVLHPIFGDPRKSSAMMVPMPLPAICTVSV